MKQYEMFELTYQAEPPSGSFVDVDLEAVFACGGIAKRVKGFYAGNGEYKIRFLPEKTGRVTWDVAGAVTDHGEEECMPADGAHGMVKAVETHFEYQDGTYFYPFGTTIYALAHQSPELIDTTMGSLSKAPFNKVRHCVFPKHYDYNHNEPEFYPFEKKEDGSWDVDRPCFAYWDHMEEVLGRLAGMGIESDLILFHPYDRWGFASMGRRENLTYLDYLLRRFSALPYVWWSLANEYDLCFKKTLEEWYEIEEYVHGHDPFGHLLSNHNCILYYDFTRPNITHCCVQTAAMHNASKWMEKYKKPVVFDECCYEGDIEFAWGNISGFEMVKRFWKGCTQGAYVTHGETFFSEDEILWWSRGGALKGESAPRIAYLRELIEGLPSPLTPWRENIFEDFEQSEQDTAGGFWKLLSSQKPEDAADLAWKDEQYGGRCGDDVFLKYLGNQACRIAVIHLPKDSGQFKVEVIDSWNMERRVAAEAASGNVRVKLDGKEGIAILATRIC